MKKPAPSGQRTSPPPRTAVERAAPAKAKQEALQKQAPPTAPTPTQAHQAPSLTAGAEKAAKAAVHAGAVAPRFSTRRAIAVVTPDAHLLAKAHHLLSLADHDYSGHRIQAMLQVSAAARLLGMPLRGDSAGGENQLTSDEQLRIARALLERARSFYAGRPWVLEHVNAAIQQLSIALSIR